MIAVDGQALLAADEAEALAELEEEGLEAIDDGLFEIALVVGGAIAELEEFEDERVLDDVAGRGDFLAGLGELADLVGVLVAGQALEEEGADLAFKLSDRPILAGGLDLVEGPGEVIVNAKEDQVVRPGKNRREGDDPG